MANSGSINAASNMNSSRSTDKFQCTYFRPCFAKTPEKKNSIPWLDNNPTGSDISDPYSDSDSEADNRRNVARWLESLPSNQDWYDVEDDLRIRQGDFKNDPNIEDLTNEKNHAAQPSIDNEKNQTSTTSWNHKKLKDTFFKTKDVKSKIPSQKSKSGKPKVHFNENPTEILSKSFKYSHLKNISDYLDEHMNLTMMQTSKNSNKDVLIRDKTVMENFAPKKCSYNLRNLESRNKKNSKFIMNKNSRFCSVKSEEYKNKSIFEQARSNDVSNQMEESKPARKLKSPFTKQASLNCKTPALFIRTACTSPYDLNETKESKQSGQKQDRWIEKKRSVDRKMIVRSKLVKNRILLKTVEDLVTIIDNNTGPVVKTCICGNSQIFLKKVKDPQLITSLKNNEHLKVEKGILNDLSSNKPSFINSKLEERLNKVMEVALNKYKRTRGTWETVSNKRNIDQLEEPPRKKKKSPVF